MGAQVMVGREMEGLQFLKVRHDMLWLFVSGYISDSGSVGVAFSSYQV